MGASPFGALDMSGNVMEWIADYYEAGYYYVSPEVDPPGPAFSMFRVMRGGTFLSPIAYPGVFRSTTRGSNYPNESVHVHGFRCAQTPP
jgi:formylglycine-generating enzyme required for sulfatase activity